MLTAFLAAGFFHRSERANHYFANEYNRGKGSYERYQQLLTEDDRRAHVRLNDGGRMFEVYNASG